MGSLCPCLRRHRVPRERLSFNFESTERSELEREPSTSPQTGFFADFSAESRRGMLSTGEALLKELDAAELPRLGESSARNIFNREAFVRFDPKPEGKEQLHLIAYRDLLGFDPLVVLFFELNCDSLDSNLEEYTVLHTEEGKDHLLICYLARSKKVLVIQPRVYYVIRYIRLYPGRNEVLDVQVSAEELGLQGVEEVRKTLEQHRDNLATVHGIAARSRGVNGLTVRHCAAKTDPHSTLGLGIARPFLAGNLRKYVAKYAEEIELFYKERKYLDGRRVVWVDKDYEKLYRRFMEQWEDNGASQVDIGLRLDSRASGADIVLEDKEGNI